MKLSRMTEKEMSKKFIPPQSLIVFIQETRAKSKTGKVYCIVASLIVARGGPALLQKVDINRSAVTYRFVYI